MNGRLVTPDVAREAQRILARHVAAATAVIYGSDYSTTDAWKLALGLGLIDPTKPAPEVTQNLYQFGVFLAHAEDAAGHETRYGTTAADFLDAIARDPIPLSDDERAAAEHAKLRAAEHLRGLGNKMGATLGSILIEADDDLARKMRSIVNDAMASHFGDDDAAKRMRERAKELGRDEGFFDGAFRSTLKRVESDLGHATGDWSRDWARIVQTEAERAIQTGLKDAWVTREAEQAEAEERPPRSLLAYKIPRPDACKHCVQLHLEGGTPRLFLLDELVENGDNVGRRAADWRPGVGPVHPYCFPAGVRVTTPEGDISIEQLVVGSSVLTHRGRWRRVRARACRQAAALIRVNGVPVTPEHPFLSGRGWVRAGELELGDNLRQPRNVPLADTRYRPALGLQVGGFAGVLRYLARAGVPVFAVDFERHLAAWKRHVDQVTTDLKAGFRRSAQLAQAGVDEFLQWGLEFAGLSSNAPPDTFFGLGLATEGSMCARCAGLARFRRHPGVHGEAGFGCSSLFESGRAYPGDNSPARYAHAASDFEDREALIKVESKDFSDVDESADHPRYSIVPVECITREGHGSVVYNISVEDDESYVAEGYIVHNCACQLVRLPHYIQLPKSWSSGHAAPSVVDGDGRLVLPGGGP